MIKKLTLNLAANAGLFFLLCSTLGFWFPTTYSHDLVLRGVIGYSIGYMIACPIILLIRHYWPRRHRSDRRPSRYKEKT